MRAKRLLIGWIAVTETGLAVAGTIGAVAEEEALGSPVAHLTEVRVENDTGSNND